MRHRPTSSGRHRPAARASARHDGPRHRAAPTRAPRRGRGARAGARLLAASVLGTGMLAVSPVSAGLSASPVVTDHASTAQRTSAAASSAPGAAASIAAVVPDRSAAVERRVRQLPEATGTGQGSWCGRHAAAVASDAAAFGRLGPTVAAWACDPLATVVGLPRTDLEREEPAQLYALVTRDLPVEPLQYAPDDLVTLFGGPYQARQEVADQLVRLFDAAAAAGHPQLRVTSGFRDYWTQAGTYEDWVRRSGAAQADRVSAQPGHSEHQLGLAVDLTGTCGGFACFGDSPEGRWVADNAHRFGFIVRYPDGGAEVTGYAYEPWHLRYVGPRAAWTMHLSGERFWESFAPVALEAAGATD